jgi:hypothetical protein
MIDPTKAPVMVPIRLPSASNAEAACVDVGRMISVFVVGTDIKGVAKGGVAGLVDIVLWMVVDVIDEGLAARVLASVSVIVVTIDDENIDSLLDGNCVREFSIEVLIVEESADLWGLIIVTDVAAVPESGGTMASCRCGDGELAISMVKCECRSSHGVVKPEAPVTEIYMSEAGYQDRDMRS